MTLTLSFDKGVWPSVNKYYIRSSVLKLLLRNSCVFALYILPTHSVKSGYIFHPDHLPVKTDAASYIKTNPPGGGKE